MISLLEEATHQGSCWTTVSQWPCWDQRRGSPSVCRCAWWQRTCTSWSGRTGGSQSRAASEEDQGGVGVRFWVQQEIVRLVKWLEFVSVWLRLEESENIWHSTSAQYSGVERGDTQPPVSHLQTGFPGNLKPHNVFGSITGTREWNDTKVLCCWKQTQTVTQQGSKHVMWFSSQ